ncbi:MAG: histidine kinase dimerization/phospho-acceptor domain-containing protein [Thiolinea sp.]
MARATVLSHITEHFRGRLILAFVLFATVFGGLFAFAVESSIRETEDYLLESYLRGVTTQALNQPEPKLPQGFAIHSYLLTDKPNWLPEKIPDYYEDTAQDKHIYVTHWPHSADEQILAVELDAMTMSNLEDQEWPIHLIMLGVVGMLILLALLVGIGIAYFMARPLVKLTHSVSKIDTTSPKLTDNKVTLYGQQRNDEIGDLSRTFSALLERMQWALQQEHSFSHHVSHEFRSPLALSSNALALLKTTDYADNPTVKTNLQRIETAQQRLHERIQLFLSLGSQSAETQSAKALDLVAI